MLSSVLLDNSRLEATIDRRTFIRLVAGSAACSFVGGAVTAGAEELDDNFTPFSPELAAEMASAFFEGAGGLSSCVCSEPIPLFDSSGQLQGYEVTATDYSDCPLGYVVFDVRCPGIVSRFSFAEGKPGPYEQIVGNLPVRVVSPSLQKFKNQVDALRQSVVMLAINEGTASAPKRAGHAMAVSGYGRITRGLTSLNCIVVHDGWSDEAFINYDFQGFMDKNGVFM